MADFVQHYGVLRWSVVAAFLAAAAIVVARLVRPAVPAGAATAVNSVPAQQESDAAHLLMCLVMLTMLIFPASAHAIDGVLIAMTVVFGILLVSRIAEWHSAGRADPVDRILAIGYHVGAAAAMLYAMSGHGRGGPAPAPALGLALVFAADAVAVLAAARTGRHWPGHPISGSPGRWSQVPHLVMDAGTAYMLIAAAVG
ncbi:MULTISPECIES: DUF5134 domain-containing protein [unclassified Nocardia]|uniref:DUF5134 domain-containing protein n=1 Tax=unclassified Nocardia TaxID=2637762 RepID=UPI001CE3C043|nr:MULTISPECIES: DUF5134 domain-containing protein [unclassified Nocardia]